MKFKLLLLILLLITRVVSSHPSWGIAVDKTGCIFLADVMHHGDGGLCKIDADHTSITVIQDNLHAHNIILSSNGNIWAAADIWREGSIEGEGHHYLIKYNPSNNTLDTVLFTDDEDVFFGNNFCFDSQNRDVYFTIRNKIFKNDLQNHVTQVIDHEFERVNIFNSDREGNIWIGDKGKNDGTLYKWNENEGLKVYAENLLPPDVSTPIFEENRHQTFYGFGFTSDGTPLICDNATRTLRKISKNGTIYTVYSSPENWHPIGVYTNNNQYYVMESGWLHTHIGPRIIILDSLFNKVKLLDIDMDSKTVSTTLYTNESDAINNNKKGSVPMLILGGIVLLVIGIVVKKKFSSK